MNIEINKVYTFKLVSGEELLAKVTKVSEDTIELSEPLSVAPGPQGMGLIPSVFTSKPGSVVQLNTKAITMYAETEPNIEAKYTETTTGISVPSKKLILG
jgi:hypothetical protein